MPCSRSPAAHVVLGAARAQVHFGAHRIAVARKSVRACPSPGVPAAQRSHLGAGLWRHEHHSVDPPH
eukprot:5575491-Alexandrium_andersonii.AAC.1